MYKFFRYRRFVVLAKRERDKKYTEWTRVDTLAEAVKHSEHIKSLGFLSKIEDKGERADNEQR